MSEPIFRVPEGIEVPQDETFTPGTWPGPGVNPVKSSYAEVPVSGTDDGTKPPSE